MTSRKMKEKMGFWRRRDHWCGTPLSRQPAGVARCYHARPLVFAFGRALPLWHGINANPYCFGITFIPETHSENSETLSNGPIINSNHHSTLKSH